MNPQSRAAVLVRIAVALTIPYIAFVLYFSLRFPTNHWPAWFINVLAVWFVANFVFVYLIGRRIFKRQVAVSAKIPVQSRKARVLLWVFRIGGSYLVLLWSIMFLYGVKEFVRGEYPPGRAIPAGAFLLFFILLFGWNIYKSFRPKA
jgi:hypothetical protein